MLTTIACCAVTGAGTGRDAGIGVCAAMAVDARMYQRAKSLEPGALRIMKPHPRDRDVRIPATRTIPAPISGNRC
jgi:hypothetical protein